jgi:hypothetical protein
MVIDGRPFEDTFYADLGAAGFAAGDDIRVTVEFRAQARALRSCDVAGYGGRVWVDQFALRPPLIKRGGRTLSASRP